MKRELGLGRCGLACCLCSENAHCAGCDSGDCPDRDGCVNRSCSQQKGLTHCYACETPCQQGLLRKPKPRGFNAFVRRYGEQALLDCLQENEKRGVLYHRSGLSGDYDDFNEVETLIEFIKTGRIYAPDTEKQTAARR